MRPGGQQRSHTHTHADEVGAEESEVLLQLFRSAAENYALLQADNAQAAACCDELAAAHAALADAAPAHRGRAATWAMHVLLACMRRLSLVISHDSSRCAAPPRHVTPCPLLRPARQSSSWLHP